MQFTHSQCFVPFGRHLNVPIVGLITVPTIDVIFPALNSPVNLAMDTSTFAPYSAPMTFFERLHNFFVYYLTRITYDGIISEQDEYMKKIYGPNCSSGTEIIRDFSLILINQNIASNGVRPFTPAIVPVGGLHVVDRNETSLPVDVKKWLDESGDAGCIYFSLGSMVRIETFPLNLINELYRSFDKIAPTRVLLRVVESNLLPKALPSNVMIKPWFQQLQVLSKKCKIFFFFL